MPTFSPSVASIQFWNAYFDRFEEVSLIDYVTALIPILEEETGLEFTKNQIFKIIDTINYENTFKVNKYESHFFIDRIWN